MRLRYTIASALGALALVVTLPTSANAAVGEFAYTYRAPGGAAVLGGLHNPPSAQCFNLPGTTKASPAYAPQNFTTAQVTLFLDYDCSGEIFYAVGPGRILGDMLKFRSVSFR